MRAPIYPSARVLAIISDVARRHCVPLCEMTSHARSRKLWSARYEALALIHAITGPDGKPKFSTPQIGAFLNRDHSSVVVALGKLADVRQQAQREAA